MKPINTLISDLHGHSYYSDGLCSPAQVVDSAVKSGLNVVALTDHNTTLGIEEFDERVKFYKDSDTKIIGIYGIEVSTKKGHILFLFDDKENCINFGRFIKVGHDKNDFDKVVQLSCKYNPFIIVPHPEVPNVNSFSFDEIDYFLTKYTHLIGSIGIEAINGLSEVVMPKMMLKKHKNVFKEHKLRNWKANLFGNSDFHTIGNIGFGVTKFETEKDITTAKEFLDFIKVLENKGEVKVNKKNTLVHKVRSLFQIFIIMIRYRLIMRRLHKDNN